jgi:prepilin-type N-terminal cleavage/methylation domain-containing protein
MRRVAKDDGYTLVELLLAAALMLIVLAGTLTVFNAMLQVNRDDQDQTEAQDAARTAITAIATDLRNVAEPNPAVGNPAVPPPAVEQASATNLVVREIDPSAPTTTQNAYRVRRVRYCLDADTTGNGKVWEQVQTWTTPATPSMPSTASCDGTGWPTSKVVATSLTNQKGGRTDRPLFTYNPSTFTDPNTVLTVVPTFWVDVDTRTADHETPLSTAFYMRNQNRPPVSSASGQPFTLTLTGSGGVTLNALAYEDPDGGTLSYVWYDGTQKIGTGPNLQWVVPKNERNTNHTFTLKVFDEKGAETDAPSQTVLVT